MTTETLTKTDLKDAIEDLKGMIQAVARSTETGKIAKIKALRADKQRFEAELAGR